MGYSFADHIHVVPIVEAVAALVVDCDGHTILICGNVWNTTWDVAWKISTRPFCSPADHCPSSLAAWRSSLISHLHWSPITTGFLETFEASSCSQNLWRGCGSDCGTDSPIVCHTSRNRASRGAAWLKLMFMVATALVSLAGLSVSENGYQFPISVKAPTFFVFLPSPADLKFSL